MKDLPFGPTTPYQVTEPVTGFQVRQELDRIEGEIEPPIQIFEIPIFEGVMAYDIELDVISVNFSATMDNIDTALKYDPEVDWRAYLGRMVEHELAHRNQSEFLSKRGISPEQHEEPHYKYLKEFQARHAVSDPVWKRVYPQEMRKATFEQVEELLERPSVWADSVMAFSREDIREVFGPHDADEAMLKLKDIAEKVRTKQDIIRYAPETKKLLGLT